MKRLLWLIILCLQIAVIQAAQENVGNAAEISRPPLLIGLPMQPWFPKAPPLPVSQGNVIRIATVDELFTAVTKIKPGGTVLLADGHYYLPRCLRLHTDRITLRGESGNRDQVVLDGAHSRDGELIALNACTGVTIADLTVQNIQHNGIKINSDSNVQKVTLYNCVLHNIWQRAVKGVKVPIDRLETMRPMECRIQYCLFYNDRPKRFDDDSSDTSDNFGGNYVGGIDVMYAQGWIISDNVFIGIQGRTRNARGAVFLWHETDACVVERNIIIDCDTGIALGNSHKPTEVPVHATRCIVKNNFISRAPENGIVADYTRDCQIVHNSIHDPTNRLGRLIRLVHDNDGLLVANNLLDGPPLRNESASRMKLHDNLVVKMTRLFVEPNRGNLHLKEPIPANVYVVEAVSGVSEDIDRKPRRHQIVGADEPSMNEQAVIAASVKDTNIPIFQWIISKPEDQGMDSAKLEAMRKSLALHNTKGLLVIRNDKIVCEWYQEGHAADKQHYTASMAKAIVGGLSLAVAMSDGLIKLDDPAVKFLPEWKNNSRKSKITIRHLGSHTSGIEDAEADGLPHEQLTGWKGDFWKRIDPPQDPFTISRDKAPMLFDAGEKMAYSNPGIAMLSYCVTASLRNMPQKDIRALLAERVMQPIGVPHSEWSIGYGKTYMVDGLPLICSWGGGGYTARTTARVGRLMLREGDWDGRQIISREAVRLITRDVETPGNCGIGWWSNNDDFCPELPKDAFWGSGAGHQILLVVPSLNLIAVRNGATLESTADDPGMFHAPVRQRLFGPLMAAISNHPSKKDMDQNKAK